MFFHIDCWRFKFLTQNSLLRNSLPLPFSPRTGFYRKRSCRNDHFMKISIKWKNLSVKSNPCWCWFAFSWWINWMLLKLLTWQNFATDSRLNQRSTTLLMTLWRQLQIKNRTGKKLVHGSLTLYSPTFILIALQTSKWWDFEKFSLPGFEENVFPGNNGNDILISLNC